MFLSAHATPPTPSSIDIDALFKSAAGLYNRMIPRKICVLASDTARCYTSDKGIYSVGREVMELGDAFRLCLRNDTVVTRPKPVRVILVLDKSGSMCGSAGCANDAGDRRIYAARLFLDRLAVANPRSEFGLVLYDYTTSVSAVPGEGPFQLTPSTNVSNLHSAINGGACAIPYSGYPKRLRTLGRTYTGPALERAMQMADSNYAAIKDSLDRHIIILTDGDWQGNKPPTILANYRAAYPGREPPVIHSVLISNGCYDPDVALNDLDYIATATGGQFISNATPADIVARFTQILSTIVSGNADRPVEIAFTNLESGQRQVATVTAISGSVNDFLIQVPRFDLAFGKNEFVYSRTLVDLQDDTTYLRDTIRINRSSTLSISPFTGSLYPQCRIDTLGLSITVEPSVLLVDEYATVRASVDPVHARHFAPGVIFVRVFGEFPLSDSGTLSLYHLNGDLGDATGRSPGSSPAFIQFLDDGFGACLDGIGQFSVAVPQLDGDFTIEAWIKPPSGAGQVFAGIGCALVLDQSGALVLAAGADSIATPFRLDPGVWVHVAVARRNGSLSLYVNGLSAGSAVSFPAPVQGTLSVGPLTGGYIDELRIRNVCMTELIGGVTLLAMPAIGTASWDAYGSRHGGVVDTVPMSAWQDSSGSGIHFDFTTSEAGDVVVNFLHLSPAEAAWSKNSDPALFRLSAINVSVALLDTNGEGHLDRAILSWPSRFPQSQALPSVENLLDELSIVALGGQTIRLRPSALVGRTDSTMWVILNENTDRSLLETGWRSATAVFRRVPMTVAQLPFRAIKYVDAAGPVISRAYYTPGVAGGGSDTIVVLLSEPVDWPQAATTEPGDVFCYFREGVPDTVDDALSGLSSSTLTRENSRAVIGVTNGFAVEPYKDSLCLRPLGVDGRPHLTDTVSSRNRPNSPNRKVAIELVGVKNLILAAFACENPFTPSRSTIPANQRGPGDPTNGTRIEAELSVPGNVVAGRLRIYDGVGHVVWNREEMSAGEKSIYAVWDGKNLDGRYVARGAYAAIVFAKCAQQGLQDTAFVRIGVKW